MVLVLALVFAALLVLLRAQVPRAATGDQVRRALDVVAAVLGELLVPKPLEAREGALPTDGVLPLNAVRLLDEPLDARTARHQPHPRPFVVVQGADVVAEVPFAVHQGPQTLRTARAAPLLVVPSLRVGDTAQPPDLEADPLL